MSDDFASKSIFAHLARGAVGFGALVGSVVLIPAVGPLSLSLLPVALIALRGCPTCWAIGLIQTLSKGRLQRSCEDGQCTLTVGDTHRVASQELAAASGRQPGREVPTRPGAAAPGTARPRSPSAE
jgi:hypothetical protein